MNEKASVQPQTFIKSSLIMLVSIALWVVVTGLAMMCLFALRDVVLWVAAFLITPQSGVAGVDYHRYQVAAGITLVGHLSAIVLAISALATVILSTEYFFRYAGQPRVIRAFIKILLVEALILAIWIALFDPFELWTVPV